MRRPQLSGVLLAVMAFGAAGQIRRPQPVGLVLGAGGSLTRGAASAAAKPGDVLFAGDTLKAGMRAVAFLFCPEKYSAVAPAGAEVTFQEGGAQVKAGALAERKAVAACFLPEVQKLPVTSQQHYGVMVARSGSQTAPKTTFEQRAAALPGEKRKQLDADLAAAGEGAAILRAAALERAGLWWDAGEAYRQAGEQYPEAAWIRRKITEMENAILKEQTR